MGHCASTVHTIKHHPGAESLSNYRPIKASGMITGTAQDNDAGPSSGGKNTVGGSGNVCTSKKLDPQVSGC